jgi:alkylation response protein AidB-like acyl-CoA dehydrogenase
VDFEFSEEQYLVRESVRAFLADHWTTARLRTAAAKFLPELWNGLVGLGLQTLLVPEAHGGAGLGFTDLVMVLEEFGRALVPGPIVDTILVSEVIARFGSEHQRSMLLPSIISGKCGSPLPMLNRVAAILWASRAQERRGTARHGASAVAR